MIGAAIPGGAELLKTLEAMKARTHALEPYHRWVGRTMSADLVPGTLRTGSPLRVRSGRLARSLDFTATTADVHVFSPLWYAGKLQKGGNIGPRRRQYMTILRADLQAQGYRAAGRRGKKKVPGAFGLDHGPQGPGLYRRLGGGGLEKIGFRVYSVRMPRFNWLSWRSEYMGSLRSGASRFVGTGRPG